MVPPGATVPADTVWVIEISAPVTVTDVPPVLLPPAPGPVQVTVTEFVIVDPPTASGLAWTTSVNITEVLPATLGSVQLMAPVPPTAGTVPQVHPAGGVIDSKRVLAGVF